MAEGQDNSRNEVEIDLDKYMALIEKLDAAEDTIAEMQEEAKKAREQFELSSFKRLLDIFCATNANKTVDALMKLELPSGVEVEIKV